MQEDQRGSVSKIGNVPMDVPVSILAIKTVHNLINQLEDRLSPVLKPHNSVEELANSEDSKSNLMQELGYLSSHLDSILDRLHL